jgi:hypothetical protein
MNNYPPSQQFGQSEEVVLENPSFYGRMKDRADRAKNAAYSMGRGVRSVGSYAYNQIPRRNGNYNPFTQTTRTPFGAVTNSDRLKNLGSAASSLFSMLRGQGGRTRKIKRKLRKPKAKKSRKRRVSRKIN